MVLRQGYSFEALHAAYSEVWSGKHGRVSESVVEDLPDAHARFFGLGEPLLRKRFGSGEWKRAVAAKSFSASWAEVLAVFTSTSLSEVKAEIRTRYPSWEKSKEFTRFINEVAAKDWGAMATSPIAWVVD